MKIIFIHEGKRVTVEDFDYITISDAVELFEQALRGAGFHFDGTLELVEEE